MILNNKIYIIAEIGMNHNGSLKLAKKSILAAKKSGADAVKFQSFDTNEFLSDKKTSYSYKKKGKLINENMFNMFKRLEFQKNWYKKLSLFCKKNSIDFLTSISDQTSAKNYFSTNPLAIKLASEDIINYRLLNFLAKNKKKGRVVLLSTGMANKKEIKDALKILKNYKIILMHCVSLYPTNINEINLRRILTLKKEFKVAIGFSDHTLGIEAPILSVAFGTKVIEKHFTLNNNLVGPDHYISLCPKHFSVMVKKIRSCEKMLGSGNIEPSGRELVSRKRFRRSIVASRDIKKDEIITAEMLDLKRPGNGLHPVFINKIIGKRIKKNLSKDQQVLKNNIS